MRTFSVYSLLLLAASFVLQSCATVGGRRQSVAFDTRPRGLSVAVNDAPAADDPQTPFATEVNRSSRLDITFHSGDFQTKISKDCDFRYGTVLLGNLGMAAPILGIPVFASGLFVVGLGTDLLTGSAFECPRVVSQDLQLPEAVQLELLESCKPVLVLPPKLDDNDVKLTYALMEEAQQFVRRYDRECSSFVSPAERAAALSRSLAEGLDYQALFKQQSERKLVQIMRDTQAVRGVDMVLRQQSVSTVEVEFRYWDLFNKTQISSFKKKFSKQKLETLRSGWLTKTLSQSLRLIPNSFALLSSSPQLNLNSAYVLKQEPITRRSLIGLLSVTSVQHPDQYDPWDVAFDFGPSFYFDTIHNRVSFDLDDPETRSYVDGDSAAQSKFDFTGYALTVPLDAVLSFHTPAGAFRTFLGLGAGFYLPTGNYKDSGELLVYMPVHFGVDWVAYFSRNWFFQLGLHAVARPGDRLIQRRGILGFDSWASGTVGVGYYFPGSSTYLETLLAKKQ